MKKRRLAALAATAALAGSGWGAPALAGVGGSPGAGGAPGSGGATTAAGAPEPPYVTNPADPTTPAREITNVAIRSWDGTVLEADEYIPDTCTPSTPCPVILIQTPYRKGQSPTDPSDLGSPSSEAIPYLYDHGYIEVVVDVRGTGSSEGYWDSFGTAEQKDGAFLVDWVASKANIPESDGKVGLAGVSYSGINQLLTAEQPGMSGPNSPLKAIFPIVSMSDAYRDVTFAGGNVDAGFIPLWLGLVNGLAVSPPDTLESNPPIALNAESQHLEDLGMFTAPAIADATLGADEALLPAGVQGKYADQAYDSPFYTVRSPITHIGDVGVPTFLVGGTYDLFQRGEPILYNALDLPPTEKKLLIGPWYHVTEGSGLTADNGTDPVVDNRGTVIPSIDNLELAWFDHWLKGAHNQIQSFPTVETYRLGADRWYQDAQYPATGTVGQRWYLSALGGGTLSTRPAASPSAAELPTVTATGTCSRSTWQWTAGIPTEIKEPFPVCENDSRASEAQGLTFTSAPFSKPYTLSGPIEADIYMSSTAADSTVVATVSDASAQGASDITAGTLVASLRQVTATPCRKVVLGCTVYLPDTTGRPRSIEPWHPYSRASQSPLQPGRVYELRIEIFPTSATIEPGHELRVTITTSDVPHELQTLSTTTSSVGVDTFYFDAAHPSSIYLGTISPLG
ncbi:MAG TPA: CocE/NonD family hydrolase [Acidimicrobiales bacterium]|nr:CocE/NonD family hydrolase [Acidimicrobiales bacterium]